MVFNFLGADYQENVSILRKSYEIAEEALSEAVERAQEECVGYQQHLDEGHEPIGEWEEGFALWTQDQLLDEEEQSRRYALHALRRSYAVALFHTWERGARQWTEANKSVNFKKLKADVIALGVAVDSRLDILWALSNAIKHEATAAAAYLMEHFPEALDSLIATGSHADLYEAVMLTDKHVHLLFEVAEQSGPDIKTIFKSSNGAKA